MLRLTPEDLGRGILDNEDSEEELVVVVEDDDVAGGDTVRPLSSWETNNQIKQASTFSPYRAWMPAAKAAGASEQVTDSISLCLLSQTQLVSFGVGGGVVDAGGIRRELSSRNGVASDEDGAGDAGSDGGSGSDGDGDEEGRSRSRSRGTESRGAATMTRARRKALAAKKEKFESTVRSYSLQLVAQTDVEVLVMTKPLFESHMRQDAVLQCKRDFALQRRHWWKEVVRHCDRVDGT